MPISRWVPGGRRVLHRPSLSVMLYEWRQAGQLAISATGIDLRAASRPCTVERENERELNAPLRLKDKAGRVQAVEADAHIGRRLARRRVEDCSRVSGMSEMHEEDQLPCEEQREDGRAPWQVMGERPPCGRGILLFAQRVEGERREGERPASERGRNPVPPSPPTRPGAYIHSRRISRSFRTEQ